MTWSEIKTFLLSYNTIVCIVVTFVGREVVWRKYLQLLILRNDCRVEHIRSDSVASPQNGTVLVWDKTEEATQIMNLWWKLIKSHHSVKNAHKVDIAAAILTAWDQAPQFGKKTKKKIANETSRAVVWGGEIVAEPGDMPLMPPIRPPAINLSLKCQHVKFLSRMFLICRFWKIYIFFNSPGWMKLKRDQLCFDH